MVDRGRAVHAGGLRGIRIERIAGNDFDAVFAPIDGLMAVIVPVVMLMFMIDAHDVPFAPGREIRAPFLGRSDFILREVIQK
jgi:hypothetical protein